MYAFESIYGETLKSTFLIDVKTIGAQVYLSVWANIAATVEIYESNLNQNHARRT